MKIQHKLIIFILFIIAFYLSACKGTEKTNGSDTSSNPIQPDPVYSGNDCSCGNKTSLGSTMSGSHSLSHANSVNTMGAKNISYVPNEIIVKFKENTNYTKADNIIQSLGALQSKNLPSKKKGMLSLLKHVKLKKNKKVEQAIAEYSTKEEVEYAHPNYIYHAFLTTNDPNYSTQWGLRNTGQSVNGTNGINGKDIHAEEAWKIVNDCSNVIVAVVDTGINYNQRDLKDNMWDGGPAFPNHGYDFISNGDMENPTVDNDPMDLNGHGTHVAGIIGANGNDSTGVSGVCWKVQLMAVRVLNAAGSGTSVSISNGINFAVSHNAHIINMSLGSDQDDPTIKSAISAANAAGVIVVVAAGNDGSTNYTYPAAYRNDYGNVISVGAIDQYGRLADFSNYSNVWVDITAPGVNILSTWAGQSTTTREDFIDWTRDTDWGIDSYLFQSESGSIRTTMLTEPKKFGYSYYNPGLYSAAYKVFDLDAYDPDSAAVSFWIDYDFASTDSLYFTMDTNGNRPEIYDSIFNFDGSSNEDLVYAGAGDLSQYIGQPLSLGFLFVSEPNSIQGYGAGIAFFETTRLYHNTTACSYMAGTSMATPHVSGVAALCIARYMSIKGSYNKSSDYPLIVNTILNNSDSYDSLSGKIINNRMLNAKKAVNGIDSLPSNQSAMFLCKWGSAGSGKGQFNTPLGIAIDSSNNVFVVDSFNKRVQKFDSNGTYLFEWGSSGLGYGQFNTPIGIAIDSSNNVYVVDAKYNRVQKFDSNGAYLLQWGSYGSGKGQFNTPLSIAIDSSNNVFVVDSFNNRIQKFDSNGTYLLQWGSAGSGNGQFNKPCGITINSNDIIYVADQYNSRVQKFDSSGTYLFKWGSYGSGNGQFNYPSYIAIDSRGSVFVSDNNNNRVQKFDSNGTYLYQWGHYGSGREQLINPIGIAIDSIDHVFVVDSKNNCVKKFK